MSAIVCFFFQAEDGIRDLVRSRGLGDVYKRQGRSRRIEVEQGRPDGAGLAGPGGRGSQRSCAGVACLLYTSDAADERSSVDLGGRRIIKKKKEDSARGSGVRNINMRNRAITRTIAE